MNHEKQHGVPKRRPLSSVGTQSPKPGGNASSLPKLAGSQAVNGLSVSARGVEIKIEQKTAEKSYRDDNVATPVKAFLSSNVTPRSGSRKARAETASPTTNRTPNGTPTTSRPTSSYERHETTGEHARAASGLGLRIANAGRRSRTGSMVGDGPGSSVASRAVLEERGGSSTRMTSPDSIPKFFHVNDMKPAAPPCKSIEESQHMDLSYAPTNEDYVSSARIPFASSGAVGDEQRRNSFYAQTAQESSSPPSRLANGSSRPPLQTIYSAHAANSPPRAQSPLKEEILPRKPSLSKPSPRRHTRLVSNGGSELKSPETASIGNGDLARRSSLNAVKNPPLYSHRRSSSVHSIGPSPPRRSSITFPDTSPVERPRTTSLVGANGALPHSVNPPSTTQEIPDHQLPVQPPSPTKARANGTSKIDQMNELAAKARRERKVLDLEISNSSLLAINRTLERKMRKQNSELRRYRRLSRSGRISITPSSRSASGKMSILSESESTLNLDDVVSSSGEEDNAADLVSSSSSTSAVSDPSSPTTRAARTRFQDPTLVELDLAAHRALLLDSQKLNLTIKRCLSHSEWMISSGKRALEYQALVSEPEKLGPRVLTPEEFETDIFSHGQGLLSPGLDQAVTNPWERSLGSAGSIDSGLETPDYSKWGPPTATQTPFAETAELLDADSLDAKTLDAEPPKDHYSDAGDVADMVEAAQETNQKEDDLPRTSSENEVRRISMTPSIDGLDDDSDSERGSGLHEERPVLTTQGTNPDSYAARAERKESAKPSGPQPGQPGYRGSMQNLGHYLQAFSIFGASQQT